MKKQKIQDSKILGLKIKEREEEVEPVKEEEKKVSSEIINPVPIKEEAKTERLPWVKIVPYESFILLYDHNLVCTQLGVCSCSFIGTNRLPKSVHVIAGIPMVIPEILLKDKAIVDRRKRGRLLVKRS